MRRLPVILSIVAVVLAGLVAAGGPGLAAVAQDATPAAACPIPIVSPAEGDEVAGPDVAVAWAAPGLQIVPAAQAQDADDYHAHFIVDGAYAVVEGVPIPQQDGVVHTAANPAVLTGLAPGEHTVQLVIGNPAHVPVPGLDRPTVAFTVSAQSATPMASPVASPAASPMASPVASPAACPPAA